MSKRNYKGMPKSVPPENECKAWYAWLVKLPERRFKALKRASLVRQKRLESELKKGFLKDERKFNQAYNEHTEILLAEQARQRLAARAA